jgi:hypothetical protein
MTTMTEAPTLEERLAQVRSRIRHLTQLKNNESNQYSRDLHNDLFSEEQSIEESIHLRKKRF